MHKLPLKYLLLLLLRGLRLLLRGHESHRLAWLTRLPLLLRLLLRLLLSLGLLQFKLLLLSC